MGLLIQSNLCLLVSCCIENVPPYNPRTLLLCRAPRTKSRESHHAASASPEGVEVTHWLLPTLTATSDECTSEGVARSDGHQHLTEDVINLWWAVQTKKHSRVVIQKKETLEGHLLVSVCMPIAVEALQLPSLLASREVCVGLVSTSSYGKTWEAL